MKNEDIIPLNFDPIFKTMFGDNKHIGILEAFISIYFKVPLSTIKGHVTVLNGEKRLKNKNDKKQVSDIIARVTNSNDTMMLNIEVNNKFSQGLIDRNIDYLSGIFHQGLKKKEKYNDLPYSIQINFNLQEVDPNNKNIIDKYYLQNENGYQLTKKYQIHQDKIIN